jgi:acyl-CoA thioester hydrolase
MEKNPRTFYTIRFNDCDPFGHLNNSRYIDYFLNAREDHLKEHYNIDLKEWALKGIGFVVSRHEIQYVRAVSYNDTVCIQSALVGFGDNYLEVEMQMYDKEQQNRKALLLSRFTQINTRTGKKDNLIPELEELARQIMVDRTV